MSTTSTLTFIVQNNAFKKIRQAFPADIKKICKNFAKKYPNITGFNYVIGRCHNSVEEIYFTSAEKIEKEQNAEILRELATMLGGTWYYGLYCGATALWSHPQENKDIDLIMGNIANKIG